MKRTLAASALALGVIASSASIAHADPSDHGPHQRPPQQSSASPAPAPAQAPTFGAQPPRGVQPPGRGFTLNCEYSHSDTVDPIVMPGHVGMSHLHEFFGNVGTDENSTGASLLADATTCNDARNHSAYWVPALYQDGEYIAPMTSKIRYNVSRGRTTAFPVGLMAVSGRTDSTAAWGCVTPGERPVFSDSVAIVPTCGGESHLIAQVTFGECWDGTNLDSANHMTHLVQATNGKCPSANPVRVPQVRITVDYPKTATGGSGVTLASGAASTLHGDIFEAWEGNALQQRISPRRGPVPMRH